MPATAPDVANRITKLFGGARIVLPNEFALHDELARRLTAAGIGFEREVRMGAKKRPDFRIDDIAVELKIDGGVMAILRQLKRYADDPRLAGVVLVTTRPVSIPSSLGGKPLAMVSLWRNLL